MPLGERSGDRRRDRPDRRAEPGADPRVHRRAPRSDIPSMPRRSSSRAPTSATSSSTRSTAASAPRASRSTSGPDEAAAGGCGRAAIRLALEPGLRRARPPEGLADRPRAQRAAIAAYEACGFRVEGRLSGRVPACDVEGRRPAHGRCCAERGVRRHEMRRRAALVHPVARLLRPDPPLRRLRLLRRRPVRQARVAQPQPDQDGQRARLADHPGPRRRATSRGGCGSTTRRSQARRAGTTSTWRRCGRATRRRPTSTGTSRSSSST